MTSTQGNMPINVSNKNSQKCSVTCMLSYDYGLSNLLATTNTNYILLSYNSPNTKVQFQDEYYQVNEVRLYSPSLNNYYGKQYDAELIIHHTNSTNNLLLCIPIEKNDNISSSSKLFNDIIPFLGQKNQPVNINVSNYTLNSFIPKGSYYLYNNSNLPYYPYNGSYNTILFDTTSSSYNNGSRTITIDNKPINISTNNLNQLRKLISPLSNLQIKTPNSNNLYYNVEGTYISQISDDDIYIDCRPTGPDGMPESDFTSMNPSFFSNNSAFQSFNSSNLSNLSNNLSTNITQNLNSNINNTSTNNSNYNHTNLSTGTYIGIGFGVFGILIGGGLITYALIKK